MTDEIYKKLIADKIVVIMRGLLKDKAIACCEALASEGIRFMEIPLNTVGALEIIAILAKHFSGRDIYIGAGTVLCPDDVSAVKNAGGQYIISPNVCETVITKTKELGMLSMPGFQTATEAFMAMNAGADILKMFPCSNIDEIAVLKSVIQKPIFAVGGVDKNNVSQYLRIADGVGVGIGIFSPQMTADELNISAKFFMQEMIS